tara:strand:- start:365 stop:553 length:189 start_codon:yes stop_codon:yes gene_type:complete
LSGERDSKGGKGEKEGQNGNGFHGTAGGVTDFNEIGELEEGKESCAGQGERRNQFFRKLNRE